MASMRTGHVDAQQSARLNWLKGTAYGAAPSTLYLGIFSGSLPLSDGTGGTEISPATRPAITFGSVATDVNGRHYMTNNAVNNIALTNTAVAGVTGWGLFSASSGGTSLYSDHFASEFQVAAGATITIPAGAIKVYAEPPTF